jgi:hypothetical protein
MKLRFRLRLKLYIKKTKLRGHSPQANYTEPSDRRLSAKLMPIFEGSATSSHDR